MLKVDKPGIFLWTRRSANESKAKKSAYDWDGLFKVFMLPGHPANTLHRSWIPICSKARWLVHCWGPSRGDVKQRWNLTCTKHSTLPTSISRTMIYWAVANKLWIKLLSLRLNPFYWEYALCFYIFYLRDINCIIRPIFSELWCFCYLLVHNYINGTSTFCPGFCFGYFMKLKTTFFLLAFF